MSQQDNASDGAHNPTSIERRGDCELVVTRIFDAPAAIVFTAWSTADLFQRWWMPRSVTGVTLLSCEMDVRTGGKHRLEFDFGDCETMAFHGTYLQVVPHALIVWTNDEGEAGAITTVTFEDQDSQTLLRFHEQYPSPQALEEALQGSAACLPEQFQQLDELLHATAR